MHSRDSIRLDRLIDSQHNSRHLVFRAQRLTKMNTAMLRSDAMKPGWYSIKLIDFRRTGRIHFDEHEDDEVEWGSGNELADRTCSVLEKLQVSFDGRLKKCRQFQE